MLVFFDDILVYFDSWAAHLIHLQLVFDVLTQQLFVKESKCDFGALKVEYLRHIISQWVVFMDEQKITCMLEWPSPQFAKELRGFFRLTG